MIVLCDGDSDSLLIFFYFLSIFLSFQFHKLILKNCVRVFSGSIKVRILEFGIYMDNEMLHGVIENQAHCSYFFLYLSIFL